jgi:hypothetical protein
MMKKETIYFICFLLVMLALIGYIVNWISSDQKIINATKV